MARRIIYSYPARLLFILCAIVAALLIINYRLLIRRDFQLLRANNAHIN